MFIIKAILKSILTLALSALLVWFIWSVIDITNDNNEFRTTIINEFHSENNLIVLIFGENE